VPSFLSARQHLTTATRRTNKNLIVVQLSGGNDGLNTIIPYRNDIYYQSRPSLAISDQKVIRIADELGFNPALQALRPIYEAGEMTIINSVGYPNPDRSHFRSMDIWHTASASEDYLPTGWLGRYLDNNCQNFDQIYHAIEVDDSLSLALKGNRRSGFAMSDPKALKRAADNKFLKAIAKETPQQDGNLGYLYKTMIDTQSSADYLYEQSKVHRSKVDYPKDAFAKDLKQISELITADTDTRIYYVSLSGFDTHAAQKNIQSRRLQQYANAMATFVKDLKQQGLLDDTLILTFSEFGRRVRQNASNGTDHGTANNLFLIGGRLQKPGFYNEAPDLSNLDQGDLRYKIDFRQIYATLLDRWLDADAGQILQGQFSALPLI
jgi:uncharacterized protein (DUF1501 family)